MLSERIEHWVQMSHDNGPWSDFSESKEHKAKQDRDKLLKVCDVRFNFRAIKRTITEEVL